MDKAKGINESPAQRALEDARRQIDDLERRWRSVQQRRSRGSIGVGQAGPFPRHDRVETMAKVDRGVTFAGAYEKLTEQAAAGDQPSDAAHKPGLAGIDADQPTPSARSTVVDVRAVDDMSTPEVRARVLAEHLESIGRVFRVCERLLAEAEQAVCLSELLAGGQLRWPDGPAGDELRGEITCAASPQAQLEVLNTVAQSMAVLSELASTTIGIACKQAGVSGSSASTGAG